MTRATFFFLLDNGLIIVSEDGMVSVTQRGRQKRDEIRRRMGK